jgi:hypothetical protein
MHKIAQTPPPVIAANVNLTEALARIGEFRLASMRLAESNVMLRVPCACAA